MRRILIINNLFRSATIKTLEINFRIFGDFKIIGNSYPKDVNQFYSLVNKWLDEFFLNNKKKIYLHIHLNYINTSSIGAILELIKLINNNLKRAT